MPSSLTRVTIWRRKHPPMTMKKNVFVSLSCVYDYTYCCCLKCVRFWQTVSPALSPYLCPVELIGGSLGQSARGNHGNRAPRRLCMDPDARPSSRTPRKPCPLPGQCLVATLANASFWFHFFLGPCRHRWMIGAMGNITLVRISKLTIVWLWHQLL